MENEYRSQKALPRGSDVNTKYRIISLWTVHDLRLEHVVYTVVQCILYCTETHTYNNSICNFEAVVTWLPLARLLLV